MPSGQNRDTAVIAHTLAKREDVDQFMQNLSMCLKSITRQQAKKAPLHINVTLTTQALPFEPMVDVKWAAAAVPMSVNNLRWHMTKCKARMDPAVYRRVRQPDGRTIRIRLLSLHDLRLLRGSLLLKGKGTDELRRRGDIE